MAETVDTANVQGVDSSLIMLKLEGNAAKLLAELAKESGKTESQVISNALALYKWIVLDVQSVPGQEVALLKNGKPRKILNQL